MTSESYPYINGKSGDSTAAFNVRNNYIGRINRKYLCNLEVGEEILTNLRKYKL